ncbi:MAG: TetR/AcrR family transcriptional regulator [Kiloniellales bacterium]
MTGLRARQKADREQRILRAAAEQFRQVGYERARIETIAALAEVSPGTVYNYYENKGDLLVAIVAMEVNEVLNAGAVLVADPPGDVARAVNELISIYLDHSLVYLSKEMWRNAMAITTQQPETRFGRAYNQLDVRLAKQVCGLIARLQAAGLVRPAVDADAVGEMVFNNTNMMFTIFVKQDQMSLDSLKATIARQNAPLLQAIRADLAAAAGPG